MQCSICRRVLHGGVPLRLSLWTWQMILKIIRCLTLLSRSPETRAQLSRLTHPDPWLLSRLLKWLLLAYCGKAAALHPLTPKSQSATIEEARLSLPAEPHHSTPRTVAPRGRNSVPRRRPPSAPHALVRAPRAAPLRGCARARSEARDLAASRGG